VDLDTLIIIVFCLIDDRLDGERIRQRGPKPKLSDSEVPTIEVVGEFLGIDADQGLYTYLQRNYWEWFPPLNTVHRITFCRPAANLWGVKERLWKHLLDRICCDSAVSLVDRRGREGVVPMASAIAQARRDSDLAVGRVLPGKEGMGARPLASDVALAA
jgi:hypothetical protein